MATITLSDGRSIPVVKPHLGDQMDLEREMRASRPKYGPKEFQEDLKLATFQTAFNLYASFRRADVKITIEEVFALDLGELGELIQLEAGDTPGDEDESEGEQGSDPHQSGTGDGASAE